MGLRVTIGHPRVTVGHPRITIGHLRLTSTGYLKATITHMRVTLGHLRVTLGHLWVTLGIFFSISNHKANTTELHLKVRKTCSTLKCKIEVLKRKNVCVYLVLQSVSVVRLQLLPLPRPLIVYLICPLQTPRHRAQPGSSTSSMHDQHHRRFYSKKSLGHQMAQ